MLSTRRRRGITTRRGWNRLRAAERQPTNPDPAKAAWQASVRFAASPHPISTPSQRRRPGERPPRIDGATFKLSSGEAGRVDNVPDGVQSLSAGNSLGLVADPVVERVPAEGGLLLPVLARDRPELPRLRPFPGGDLLPVITRPLLDARSRAGALAGNPLTSTGSSPGVRQPSPRPSSSSSSMVHGERPPAIARTQNVANSR
jgi:hypothetical protein